MPGARGCPPYSALSPRSWPGRGTGGMVERAVGHRRHRSGAEVLRQSSLRRIDNLAAAWRCTHPVGVAPSPVDLPPRWRAIVGCRTPTPGRSHMKIGELREKLGRPSRPSASTRMSACCLPRLGRSPATAPTRLTECGYTPQAQTLNGADRNLHTAHFSTAYGFGAGPRILALPRWGPAGCALRPSLLAAPERVPSHTHCSLSSASAADA